MSKLIRIFSVSFVKFPGAKIFDPKNTQGVYLQKFLVKKFYDLEFDEIYRGCST